MGLLKQKETSAMQGSRFKEVFQPHRIIEIVRMAATIHEWGGSSWLSPRTRLFCENLLPRLQWRSLPLKARKRLCYQVELDLQSYGGDGDDNDDTFNSVLRRADRALHAL